MRHYAVEFFDGESDIMTANLIVENIISRVDNEGTIHSMQEEIEDHKVLDGKVPNSEGIVWLSKELRESNVPSKDGTCYLGGRMVPIIEEISRVLRTVNLLEL